MFSAQILRWIVENSAQSEEYTVPANQHINGMTFILLDSVNSIQSVTNTNW